MDTMAVVILLHLSKTNIIKNKNNHLQAQSNGLPKHKSHYDPPTSRMQILRKKKHKSRMKKKPIMDLAKNYLLRLL
jgi:hypothetical protein